MEIRGRILALIKEYYAAGRAHPSGSSSQLPLMSAPFGEDEVVQALDSLLSGYLTLNQFKKRKVLDFEDQWSKYISVTDSLLVNSGSSANFLGLQVLANPGIEGRIEPGDEIITPAVTWSTTVFPIYNAGAVPVFVDVDLASLTIDTQQISKAITSKTKALMIVHLLGNACNMDAIQEICRKHNLFLIEDCCEAHGAEYGGKKIGGFGDLSTFSFFFSHHITTIEGGALCTSNESFAETARILRSQGVARNLKNKEAYLGKIRNNEEYRDIDESYLFLNMGFNLRPTEITGGFGLEQMKKIDGFIETRIQNAHYLIPRLEKFQPYFFLPQILEGMKQSWFAFPFIIKPESGIHKQDLTDFLTKRRIENRPIMSGNMTRHPVMELYPYKAPSPLKNADLIHSNGFLVGNNENISRENLDHLVSALDDFFKSKFK